MKKQEFDRSLLFSMHYCIHEQIMNIRKEFDDTTALNVYEAIANYAYFGTEITDMKLKILVGSATLDKIEHSQEYRSQWFGGENLEQTKLVAEYMRDHPNASQRTIALATGASKTKVVKVQKNFKESGFSNVQEYLDNIVYPKIGHTVSNVNTNTNASVNVNVTETATSPRDHSVVTTDSDAGHTHNSASLTQQAAPDTDSYEQKLNTYNDQVVVMKYFQQHKKPAEIVLLTGFSRQFINDSIDIFRKNHDCIPKPPVNHSNMIIRTDGEYFMDMDEYFNDCTNNGKNSIDEMPWDIIKENLIENKAMNPDGVITEMKQRLLKINTSKHIMENIA